MAGHRVEQDHDKELVFSGTDHDKALSGRDPYRQGLNPDEAACRQGALTATVGQSR